MSWNAFSPALERIAFSTPMVAIREGFIISLPYVILANVFGLASGAMNQFLDYDANSGVYTTLSGFSAALQIFFPHFIVAAIAAALARQYYLGRVTTAAVVLIGYWILSGWIPNGFNEVGLSAEGPFGFWLFPAIFITFPLFLTLSKVRALQMTQAQYLNPLLKDSINLILPVLATVLCLIILKALFNEAGEYTAGIFEPLANAIQTLPYLVKLVLLVLLVHCAWFIGIHGYNANIELASALIAQAETQGQIHPEFLQFYVHIGGSGTTLALVIVMLLSARHIHNRRIAGIAAPMALFNINEVVLFGLPIIFNPRMLIPFITIPVMLTIASYLVQVSGIISLSTVEVSWMMPPILSAYVATDGDWLAVVFQLLCIVFAACVYWRFFRALENAGVDQRAARQIRDKLSIGGELNLRETAGLSEVHSHLHDIESYRSLAAFDDTERTISLLREGDFLLHYQPQQSIKTGKITGFEALLRYRDPDGTLHPPTFFSALKKTGLHDTIERWVIYTACQQLREWHRAGVPAQLSVNVSADFFSNQQLLDVLKRESQEHNLLQSLDIEITEHDVVSNLAEATRTIDELHALGVSISIDDFGAGYSALAYLDTLQTDALKIDKSLTDVIEQSRGQIIVQEVIDLAYKLNMHVVVEGVETEAQYAIAKTLNADSVQGYWIGRPAPAGDWQARLRQDIPSTN